MKGVSLIGMPGAGKSTVAPLLGKELGWPVIDVDTLISAQEGKTTRQIVAAYGGSRLTELEAQCVTNFDLHDTVLSTPGSIVYTAAVHAQLKAETRVVWLDISLGEVESRFVATPDKGLVRLKEAGGLAQLYTERRPLYQELADFVIDCSRKDAVTVTEEILAALGRG